MGISFTGSFKRLDRLKAGAARAVLAGIFGNGFGGNITTSGIVNSYAHLTSGAASGDDTLLVNSTAGFNSGDKVLIHQTQHINTNIAGTYEFSEIESVSSGQIKLKTILESSYFSDPGTAESGNQSSTMTQVVGTKQYSNFTANGLVEAKQWDGFSGGILYIVTSDTLTCNGNWLSVWAKGFRGGRGENNFQSNNQGYAGESIRGFFDTHSTANDTGGAGARGNQNTGGDSGGSAGYATQGRPGDNANIVGNVPGGGVIGSNTLDRIFFGGGAGRGGDNDDRDFDTFLHPASGAEMKNNPQDFNNVFGSYTTSLNIPWGATRHETTPDFSHGGGIAIIHAKNTSDLKVISEPMTGIGGDSSGEKSGSGAAGSIFISTNTGSTVESVFARGTTYAELNNDFASGGSAGRIRVDIFGGDTLNGSGNILVTGRNGLGDGTIVTNSNLS